MGVEIMCAAATTANPEANVFPGPHNVTSCELELRSGEALPTPITGIEEAGDVTSFFYGFDPTAPFISFDGKALKSFDAEFGKTQPTQIVDLSGVRLVDDVDVYFNYLSRTKFRVRVYDPDAEEQEFAKEIALVPGADSTVNVKLEIQFAPTELSHNEPVEDVLVIRTGNIKKVFPITGYSRVPNNIYPTVAYDAAEVSPYSFVASWKPVEPATGYYLSVYSITDEPFSDVESFDGFDNGAPEGWEATFSTTATTAATAPAALFTLAADTLFTKEYFMPLDGLSYWRHSNNSAGTLLVDALNAAGVWENIWKEDFDATTRGRQVTVSLADTAEYRRFKVYVEFKSAGGGLSFDNFSAEFSKKISYVYDNGYVASPDTSFLVGGLAQGTLYNYSVVATQWEAKSGSQDKLYEYLSDPSNIVGVSTVEGEPEESRYMTITRCRRLLSRLCATGRRKPRPVYLRHRRPLCRCA